MNMSLSKLWGMLMNRQAWCAAVHGATKNWTQLSDWRTTTNITVFLLFSPLCLLIFALVKCRVHKYLWMFYFLLWLTICHLGLELELEWTWARPFFPVHTSGNHLGNRAVANTWRELDFFPGQASDYFFGQGRLSWSPVLTEVLPRMQQDAKATS